MYRYDTSNDEFDPAHRAWHGPHPAREAGHLVLELAILGRLEGQAMHGYEIRKRLRDELGQLSNVSFGSLYPALSRLERSGAVRATEDLGRSAAAPVPMTGSLSGERAALRARAGGHGPRAPEPQGLRDHRGGPPPVRRAPPQRAGRGERRRPQLQPPPGLRPLPAPPRPPAAP